MRNSLSAFRANAKSTSAHILSSCLWHIGPPWEVGARGPARAFMVPRNRPATSQPTRLSHPDILISFFSHAGFPLHTFTHRSDGGFSCSHLFFYSYRSLGIHGDKDFQPRAEFHNTESLTPLHLLSFMQIAHNTPRENSRNLPDEHLTPRRLDTDNGLLVLFRSFGRRGHMKAAMLVAKVLDNAFKRYAVDVNIPLPSVREARVTMRSASTNLKTIAYPSRCMNAFIAENQLVV